VHVIAGVTGFDGAGALERVGDDELLAGLLGLARDKRANDAAMLAHVAEVDRRRLYAREGWSSMFVYCVEVLRLSEGAAWKRIGAAPLARKYPLIIDLIASGELHLGGVALLSKHLTDENHRSVLDRARGKTCRQIEKLVAALAPRPDVPASLRKLPRSKTSSNKQIDREQAGDRSKHPGSSAAAAAERGTVDVCSGTAVASGTGGGPGTGVVSGAGGVSGAEAVPGTGDPGAGDLFGTGAAIEKPARVEVLAPERYLLKVTLAEEAKRKLDRARDLMRHAVPDGDVAVLLERALDALIEKAEKRKFGKLSRPRKARAESTPTTTLVKNPPAALRREVSARDEECCSYTAPDGKRCRATAWLEFHHLLAAAKGGPMTVENCSLFCKAHNQYAADVDYGRGFMERMRHRGRPARARERGPVWSTGGTGELGSANRMSLGSWDPGARCPVDALCYQRGWSAIPVRAVPGPG
jgi:hypothetical protein